MTLAASKPSHAGAARRPNSDPGSGQERLAFAVIGGGISGLALATWLRAEGVEVTVLDKSSLPGGVIGTVREEGFTFERGPSTILDKCDAVNEIIDLAGLSDQVIRSPMREHERYIWRAGRLHAVPMGPGGLLGTKLISAGAKARLLREPFVAPEPDDEPLREFVTRRLGPEIYERAFVPMVSGLSAGDPAEMSTAASFPFLKELERLGGSLFKGALKKRKADRLSASGPPRARARNIVNFTGGLARLPEALANRLGESYVSEVDVKSIEPGRGSDGFLIRARHQGRERIWRADRLAMCGDNLAVANWLEGFEPEAARRLRSIHYCSLAVIGLGVEATALSIPPGFGFLTVRDAGVRVLGSIFQSNVLPDRAPERCAALSVMVGGDLDPEGAALDDDELMDVVRRDLKTVLGWDGRLKHCLIQRWPRAIPRYGLDYFEILQALEAVEARRPGLRLFGNWRQGTAIGDRIDQAKSLAIEISKETAPAVG